jgi:protein-S-isoprenylcysteine O-methyltransferase Ste14
LAISRRRLRLTRLFAVCILLALAGGTAFWTRSYPIVGKALFIFGLILAGFGATGRAWATTYISGQKLRTLVRSGPYSLCRNPLYFFSMILAVGFGFCTATLTIPLLIFFSMALLYSFQIRREERRLAEVFGDEYKTYIETTPRFIPSLRNYFEPEIIHLSPIPLMKGLVGIGFLLALIALVQLLDALHQINVLPSYFHIY